MVSLKILIISVLLVSVNTSFQSSFSDWWPVVSGRDDDQPSIPTTTSTTTTTTTSTTSTSWWQCPPCQCQCQCSGYKSPHVPGQDDEQTSIPTNTSTTTTTTSITTPSPSTSTTTSTTITTTTTTSITKTTTSTSTTQSDECHLIVDGEKVSHSMFPDPGNITVKIAPTTAECDMKILAIGGGGGSVYYSGGGSGYISYTTRTISTEEIRIYVGDKEEHSVVSLNNGDEVRAEPGENGRRKGGSGYSGGGAYCRRTDGCNGGYNGGDGEDRPYFRAGRGTGEDVTQYKFDHYKLSPGDAGERYYSSGGYYYGWYYGGGGGGVMINGVGPDRESKHQGQGYGGGGGAFNSGLPGVVILEIVN